MRSQEGKGNECTSSYCSCTRSGYSHYGTRRLWERTVEAERADLLTFIHDAADTSRELSISELPGAPEGFTRVGIGCAYSTAQMMEEALSLPAGRISESDMPAPNTEGQNSLIWLEGDTVLETWMLASLDLDFALTRKAVVN